MTRNQKGKRPRLRDLDPSRIHIELDAEEYRFGEWLTGRVVTDYTGASAGGLQVRLVRRVDSRRSGSAVCQTRSQVAKDGTFRLKIARRNLPASFTAEHMSVLWVVELMNGKQVLCSANTCIQHAGITFSVRGTGTSSTFESTGMAISGAVGAVIAIAWGLQDWTFLRGTTAVLAALAGVVVMLMFGSEVVQNYFAARRIKDVHPRILSGGSGRQQIVEVRMQPHDTVDLEWLVCSLACTAECSGSTMEHGNRTRFSGTIGKGSGRIRGKQIEAGEEFVGEVTIELPSLAIPAFRIGKTRVDWSLGVSTVFQDGTERRLTFDVNADPVFKNQTGNEAQCVK
jgi:hypothetical protein